MTRERDFNLANLLAVLLVINIFQMIDMLSCGSAMFYSSMISYKYNINSADAKILSNLGCLTYGYSTIIGMVAYACFSKINASIMAGPIVESLKPMCEAYSESILREVSSIDAYYTNMLVHLFVTAVGFSFFSFLIYLSNKANYLNLVPKSVTNGLFGAIGLGQLKITMDCLGTNSITNIFENNSLRNLFMVSVLVVIVYCILERWFKAPDFLVPLYFFFIVGAFYSVALFLYGNKDLLKNVRDCLWLENTELPLLPNYCFDRLKLSYIKWNILMKNSLKIFSMVLLSSIHIMVNLPAYRMVTKVPTNLTRELKTQGLSNLFTIVPSYFICSFSIAAYKCGGKHRYYSAIGGLSLMALVIFGVMIKGFIPKFALSLVPGIMFVGFSLSAFYDTLFYISIYEYAISVAVCTSIQLISHFKPYLSDYSYSIALLLGFVLYLCVFGIIGGFKKIHARAIDFVPSDTGLVVIDHMLWFCTAISFRDTIRANMEKNIIIDLRRCPAIDWISQDIIYNTCNITNKVILVGEPRGFRKKRFKLVTNCFCFRNYHEFIVGTCDEV